MVRTPHEPATLLDKDEGLGKLVVIPMIFHVVFKIWEIEFLKTKTLLSGTGKQGFKLVSL